MEARFDPSFMRPSPLMKATALGLGALGIGVGTFIAAFGLSYLWHPVPPEPLIVRLANPEVRLANPEVKVKQDAPLIVEQAEPFKVSPAEIKIAQQAPPIVEKIFSGKKTGNGNVIQREVTVFSNVEHEGGSVVTRWVYKDGSGGTPDRQSCYYNVAATDGAILGIELASNRETLKTESIQKVPRLSEALKKCQWW